MAGQSLRGRILLGAMAVNLLVFAAAGTVILFNARTAARTEILAAQAAAVALIRSTVTESSGFAAIEQPRHVRILTGDGPPPESPAPVGTPAWFHRWIAPDIPPAEITLPAADGTLARIRVMAEPDDEIVEVWEDVRALTFVWIGAVVAQMLLLTVITGRALRPIKGLNDRLRAIGEGDLVSRIGPVGTPELAPVAQRIDALAETLAQERQDRQRVAKRLLEARDSERRGIARDLHDELGPCLFGLTVEADALRPGLDRAQQDHVDAIMRHVAAIRAINRRVLEAVRPVTLGHLPIADVVQDLVGDLTEIHRGVEIRATIPADLPPPGETVSLSIYRAIQEGVTNALRHGGARRVGVMLDRAGSAIRLILRDDGRGLAAGWRHGSGLMGMIERAEAIGGEVSIRDTGEGTELRLLFPVEAT